MYHKVSQLFYLFYSKTMLVLTEISRASNSADQKLTPYEALKGITDWSAY